MTARTPERIQFLGDIITTAVEGGSSHWVLVTQYQYEMDGVIIACVGSREGDEPRAILHEINDDGDGYLDEPLYLTIDAVASALCKIGSRQVRTSDKFANRIMAANRDNDAGDIDAGDADTIVQIALLGEERYG